MSERCPPGLRASRLADPANECERAFSAAWQRAHAHTDLLRQFLPEEPSERDRVVASSVIQWLGTNVGQSLIRAAQGAQE